MGTRPEVGISFLPNPDHQQVTALAKEVGKSPFDVVSSYEDLGYPSPLLQLYAFAQHSDTARIGPACLVVPKYRTMETVLSQLALLESLRPGKLFLGLAPGAWLHELAVRSARVQQLQEAVDSFVYLLNKKVTGFRGEFYTVKPGFTVQYETPSTLPIMVGAWGEKMLAMAGANRHVSEVKGGGSANPQMVRLLRQRLKPGLAAANRNEQDVGVVLGAVTVIDRDRQHAMQMAKRRAAMYIDVIGEKDPFALEEYGDQIKMVKALLAESKPDEAARGIPDDLAKMFVFAGTPEDVIEQALSVYEAGAKRIEFGSPHGLDTIEGIRLLSTEVLPVLQQLSPV